MRRWHAAAMLLLAACGGAPEVAPVIAVPPDFPALPHPPDNPPRADRIALGRRLFFDPRLSRSQDVSCGSCHKQEHAFADPRRVSEGVRMQRGTRNAPGLFNLAWGQSFFWDGGVDTLEKQAIAPILSPEEMDMTLEAVAERLQAVPSYVDAFAEGFGTPPSPAGITRALAAFMRSLVSGHSRYDRWRRGDASALSAAERRGHDVFMGEKGECFHCHQGFNFTNETFQNNGLPPDPRDPGRGRISHAAHDVGRFKVPSLRNVAVSAPYMHDGSLATLPEVIEHYDRGGVEHPNKSPLLAPLGLSAQEKADLLAFLGALTDEDFLRDTRHAAP